MTAHASAELVPQDTVPCVWPTFESASSDTIPTGIPCFVVGEAAETPATPKMPRVFAFGRRSNVRSRATTSPLLVDQSTVILDTFARLEATAFLLDALVHSPIDARDDIRQRVCQTSRPSDVLIKAIIKFRDGCGEEYLIEAAQLLHHYGAQAWIFLNDLALSGADETEYFVHTIASLEGVPLSNRLATIASLALSGSKDTRYRVLEVAASLGPSARGLLNTLRDDPDEEISDAAADRIARLGTR